MSKPSVGSDELKDLMARSNARIAWVPVSKMRVDLDYVERKLDARRAQKMADEFDPDAVGLIHVSLRGDGFYYILDGQHRVRCIELAIGDDQKAPCKVFEGLTLADEARLFELINRTAKPQVQLRFVRRVQGGRDEKALAMNSCLLKYGLSVQAEAPLIRFRAVQALEDVWDMYGPAAADAAFWVIQNAWGEHSPYRPAVLKALAKFVTRYPQADKQRLARRLSKVRGGCDGLWDAGKAQKELRWGSVADGVADVITETYNRGLPQTSKLPRWE